MDAGLQPALGRAESKKTSASVLRMAFVFLLSARPTRAQRGPSVALFSACSAPQRSLREPLVFFAAWNIHRDLQVRPVTTRTHNAHSPDSQCWALGIVMPSDQEDLHALRT